MSEKLPEVKPIGFTDPYDNDAIFDELIDIRETLAGIINYLKEKESGEVKE